MNDAGFRLRLGNVTVDRIVEQEAPLFNALEFFPTLTKELLAENSSWLRPRYIDWSGKLVLCIQSHVVRTPHHTILVDTCIGNHKPRTQPFWNMRTSDRYEKQLAAVGLRAGDIDFVMCTHLHVDHVGWNTRLENGRWVPTFPRAKYLFSGRELAYWTEKHNSNPAKLPWITDSVLPIVEAGRAELVESDHALTDLVELVPSPGHTIDHFCVRIGRPGEDAIITGDMMHSPLQVRYPEIGMSNDYSSSQAEETRRRIFDEVSESATLLCSAHFPSPSSGRIVRRGTTFDYEPLPS